MPADMPVTIPAVTDAIPLLLLAHVPPPVASVNVVEDPTHTEVAPLIAAGTGQTVTGLVTRQPLPDAMA
jgi:hypothetical protein